MAVDPAWILSLGGRLPPNSFVFRLNIMYLIKEGVKKCHFVWVMSPKRGGGSPQVKVDF